MAVVFGKKQKMFIQCERRIVIVYSIRTAKIERIERGKHACIVIWKKLADGNKSSDMIVLKFISHRGK